MKLSDWIDIWLETYKIPFLKYNSMECLKNCLNHIQSYFYGYNLSDIKGYQIQQFLNSLKSIPNVQFKVKVYFNEILDYAVRNRELDYNPMLAIKFRIPKQTHRRAMTKLEREKFIKSLDGKRYRLLYLTYLYTGARRNELIESDAVKFDFENSLVHLNGTKTKKAVRVVPLFEPLKKELLKVKNYKKYYTSFKPDYVTKTFLKHCRKVGILGYCVHSLRTTFATMCFESKVDMKTIQNWLGHSKIETTMDVYVDSSIYFDYKNDYVISEKNKLNNFLK